MESFKKRVFKKAALCRNFENETYKVIQNNIIKYPVYLSAGQEFIASSISESIDRNIFPNIFIQHRGHSTYLSFGGPVEQLVSELLGFKTGCANGMGGSASIQCKEKHIFGHDGLMASQVPIAVGNCFITKKPTIVFMGDSSAEEDYVFSSIGWASTKNLPILFIVEDNNLSILTEKSVRRNWSIVDVAKGFGIDAYDISDDPEEIKKFTSPDFVKPLLLNINTIRRYWHAGAGIDDENVFDRYEEQRKLLGEYGDKIHYQIKKKIKKVWKEQLEKL
tara:strand:- start:7832 stop:8662 length:831 start_codon:yes stop_codon:yes gene_type:complete